jgi:predicted transcriptional regulator
MSIEVSRVLAYPGLSDREVRVILTIEELSKVKDVIKEDLITYLSISKSTVERVLRSLKQKGILLMKRSGPYRWIYSFTAALHSDDDAVGLHPDDASGDLQKGSSAVGLQSDEDPQERGTLSLFFSSSLALFKNTITYLGPPNVALHLSEDPRVKMAPLRFKQRSSLSDALEEVVSRPPKEKPPKKPFSWPSREERLRDKMEDKSLDEYNCNDMRFVFEDAWKAKGWRGSIPRWVGKDRGLMKRLIVNYGAEQVVLYVKYVIKNWEDVCRRYKIHGYPTVGILSAYSRSLYPEMVNGLPVVHDNEYRDRSMVVDASVEEFREQRGMSKEERDAESRLARKYGLGDYELQLISSRGLSVEEFIAETFGEDS